MRLLVLIGMAGREKEKNCSRWKNEARESEPFNRSLVKKEAQTRMNAGWFEDRERESERERERERGRERE